MDTPPTRGFHKMLCPDGEQDKSSSRAVDYNKPYKAQLTSGSQLGTRDPGIRGSSRTPRWCSTLITSPPIRSVTSGTPGCERSSNSPWQSAESPPGGGYASDAGERF
jgi:hypothetical protein